MTGLDRRGFLAGTAAAGTLTFLGTKRLMAQSRGGVLRFGLSSYPPSFEAWTAAGTAAGTIKLMIHRGLLGYDAEGRMRGELAESWSVDDDGVWTFNLREARFHDGSPVTSEDIRWNIEQAAADDSTAFFRAQMQSITDIDTPDERTIRLATAMPAGTLPNWFAHYHHPMIKKGSDKDTLIGAGPFKFVSRERGVNVVVEANEDFYRPGLPRLAGIEAIVYADENLRVAALEAGDIDLIEYVPWPAMSRIEANDALRLDTVSGPFMYLIFNGTRPPFDNPKVRKAVAHAVRREDIVAAAFFDRGAPLEHLPIAAESPFFNADLANGWAYDPELSRQLLAEAGYPNGFNCTMLSTAQYGMHQSTAEVVQAYLAMVGINATLDLPDWSTRVQQGNEGRYDLAVMGTTADSNDPDGLTNILDGSLPPSFARSFGVSVDAVNAALAEGRATFDPDARREIYHRMEAAAIEEVPIAGMAWRSQGYAMKTEVEGFTNMPGQLTFYSGTTFETTSIG